MASLANTKWTLTIPDLGETTFTFSSDGTASAGGSLKWYWAEDNNGNWMIQALNPMLQDNCSQVYYGTHQNGQGQGFFTNGWQGAKANLQTFTMVKD